MIQLYKYVSNKYDVNFKSKSDYQSMLEMSYNTRGIDINWSPNYSNTNL